jgi:hypothetical protein
VFFFVIFSSSFYRFSLEDDDFLVLMFLMEDEFRVDSLLDNLKKLISSDCISVVTRINIINPTRTKKNLLIKPYF